MNYGTFGSAYESADSLVASDTRPPLIFDIKDADNFQEILSKFPVVVVDAWAKWCNPCKLIMPRYNDLAYDFEEQFNKNQVIFLKDHIDDPNSIHRADISVVPTFFLYINGTRYTLSSFSELRQSITSALQNIN